MSIKATHDISHSVQPKDETVGATRQVDHRFWFPTTESVELSPIVQHIYSCGKWCGWIVQVIEFRPVVVTLFRCSNCWRDNVSIYKLGF